MTHDRPTPPGQTPGSVDFQLRVAIRDRRLVGIRYRGLLRIAEPHDYGVHKGVVRLLIYQLQTERQRPARADRGWRLLDVSQVEQCVVMEQPFRGSRGPSSERHMTWDVLYARVK